MEKTLSTLLSLVRLRPLLYLHAKRATLLEPFIQGYMWTTGRIDDTKMYAKFRDWLPRTYKLKMSPSIAAQLIELTGSDEAAFDEFFRLFDQFVKSDDVTSQTGVQHT